MANESVNRKPESDKSVEAIDPETGEIVSLRDGDYLPTQFQPQAARIRDAKADAVIAFAKKVKDWPLLENATDQKLDELEELVTWWKANVSPRHGGDQVRRSAHLPLKDAEHLTGFKHQQISKCGKRLKDRQAYRAAIIGVAYHKAMMEVSDTTASKWTGDPESYTPEQYIEAARATMGGIDLDPASNALAQETVQAARWYSEADDGLSKPWTGRVFLNPPYNYPIVAQFIEKLCSECRSGNVTAAILLTNNNTDTKWWHAAARTAKASCPTLGRINFYKADGSETQPTNGQTFFYFGDDVDAFARQFSQFGLVMPWPEGWPLS